jgi:hypothetical protein
LIPLLGFVPDAPTTTPGVLTDCAQLIPSEKGMQSAPSAVGITGLSALPAAARGAAVLVNTSGTRRTIVGTQTRLFELSGSTYSEVTGITYTGSSENRWMFAQFGDAALATNDTERIQASTSGTFAGITAAPLARIIISVPNFVLAFNTNDSSGSATFGDSPDRWWCSAFQNHTDWTPATTTQCTTGRLVESGGEISAAAPFGSGCVAYKARAMYLGQYVGPPVVFQFDRIPGEQGCVGPEAVCDIGGAHIFVGEDNIWLYDGTRPVPIAQEIRQWFFNDISATYKYRTIVTYDRNNGRVWVFYPSTVSSGNPDSAVVYHLNKKRWGRANRTVEAVFNFVTPGLTWDTLSSLASTWDTLPLIPWDSQSWQAAGRALAFFDSSHNLKTLTGSGENSGMTTGDLGDDINVATVNRVVLRFETEPTSATITGQTKSGQGATAVAAGSGSLSGSKFDIRQTGQWHRFAFLFTGNTEVSGLDTNAVKAGER